MTTPAPTPAFLDQYGAQGPGTGNILLMLFYLALVLVGVYYATRLFARIGQRGFVRGGRNSKKRIYILDRLMLDKDKSITILQVDDKEYLLGITAQGMQILRESEAPEAEPNGEENAVKTGKPPSFTDMLTTFRERGKK